MADGKDGKEPEKPSLKVVSDNPKPDKTRSLQFAREEAERTLAIAAATMLRTIAGSGGAAAALRNDMMRALVAEDEYQALSGQWLTSWERQKALALAEPEWKQERSDYEDRKYERDCGLQYIVQGALRLAAHQILGEEPHFGGKHSTRLIDEGMAAIERAKPPRPPPAKPLTRKQVAEQKAARAHTKDIVLGDGKPEPRRKPWSSRDSKSYRDLEPEK